MPRIEKGRYLSRIDDAGTFFPLQIEAVLKLFGDEGFQFLRHIVIIGLGLHVILMTLLNGGRTTEAGDCLSPQYKVVVTYSGFRSLTSTSMVVHFIAQLSAASWPRLLM
jgi:hypothetical protein